MLSQTEATRLIAIANERLGKAGLKLELGGKRLNISIRGTFPPKPGERRKSWYQTRIALKMRAIDKETIKLAETTAREIALDVNRGTFDWRKFSDHEEVNGKTLATWKEDYRKYWWRSRSEKDLSAANTWRIYEGCLKRLPETGALTLNTLIDWVIQNSEPDSVMRRHYVITAKGLAKLGSLPTEELRELSGNQSIRPINPRLLPTDEAIVELRNGITDPGWQFLVGLMACYGLRNHEVWFCDYAEFPVVRVHERSKTGSRPVLPLYPEWAEAWSLDKPIYPQYVAVNEALSNRALGEKITNWFKKHVDWGAYNLRHCYSRRCLQFGISPEVAAKLLGHSLNVHMIVYKAWVDESVFLKLAQQATESADRPRSPNLSPTQADT